MAADVGAQQQQQALNTAIASGAAFGSGGGHGPAGWGGMFGGMDVNAFPSFAFSAEEGKSVWGDLSGLSFNFLNAGQSGIGIGWLLEGVEFSGMSELEEVGAAGEMGDLGQGAEGDIQAAQSQADMMHGGDDYYSGGGGGDASSYSGDSSSSGAQDTDARNAFEETVGSGYSMMTGAQDVPMAELGDLRPDPTPSVGMREIGAGMSV